MGKRKNHKPKNNDKISKKREKLKEKISKKKNQK